MFRVKMVKMVQEKETTADKDAGAGIDDAAEALLASQLDAMAVKLRSLKAQIEFTS